jgi:RNA polymerase sigma-70 factor (ECF subfamily)
MTLVPSAFLNQPLWNILRYGVSILSGEPLRAVLLAARPASPAGETRVQDRLQDKQLIQEALQGEPGFERLVRLFERLVFRVAFRYLGEEQQAADVSQEVFLRVYRALPGFRGESALSSWIYAITANLSRNVLRSRRKGDGFKVLSLSQSPEDEAPLLERLVDMKVKDADRILENKEFARAAQAALMKLPVDYHEAVILRDIEGLEYSEIAQVLKIEIGTVKSRIARGRVQLRDELKDWL